MLKGTYLIQMECIYRNGRPVQGAVSLLDTFHQNSIPFLLISEQSASSRTAIAERMQQAGLNVHPQNIYTGAYAACSYIHWRYPERKRIYSVGGRGIRDAMDHCHLIEDRKRPDYVLIGLDRDLTYADYNDILHVLNNGAKLITVDNRIVQYKDGEADLGNGAIVKMLEYASGIKAISFGRGSERMIRWCLRYLGVNAENLLVAGNDFRRDILPAIDLGCTTFLVSEGRDITVAGISSQLHPDYIVDTVNGIAK